VFEDFEVCGTDRALLCICSHLDDDCQRNPVGAAWAAVREALTQRAAKSGPAGASSPLPWTGV
jgi:hypothetical protein